MRVWLTIAMIGFLAYSAHAQSLSQPLRSHLTKAAERYSLRLIYSPSAIPDTNVVLAFSPSPSRKQMLDRLTKPFGLSYTLIGQQLIVTLSSKSRFGVSGYVEDLITGERLVGATVTTATGDRGTLTNGYGYYSLAGLQERDILIISYVGYPASEITVSRATASSRIVRLKPAYELSTVEVRPTIESVTNIPNTGVPLPPQILRDSEFTFGEPDINTFLTSLPGVQSRPAGFGGYSIRGADPTQNLVLVDDATLYLPSHAAGLTGAVSGDAIRSLQLFKHAGHARYGDRVGGVVDIRLKEGSREQRKTSLSAGISDIRLATEGPVGKGSYFATARRGLTDFWLDLARPSIQPTESRIPDLDFVYYDFTGKVNFPLGERQRIYASVYVGRDNYKDRDEVFNSESGSVDAFLDQSTRSWSNALATLRHNASVGSKWFFATTATLSGFTYDATDFFLLREALDTPLERYTFAQSQFATNVLDLGLKHDAEYAIRPGATLEFGLDAVAHRFRVGTQTSTGDQLLVDAAQAPVDSYVAVGDLPELNTYDVSLYGNLRLALGKKAKTDIGMRISSQLGNSQFVAALPRLALNYQVDNHHEVQLLAGASRQYLHSVSTLNPGLPRDIWVPSVAGLRPQESRYLSLGLNTKPRAKLQYAVTAYYQEQTGLARFSSNFASLALDRWVDQLRQGKGAGYGVETELAVPLNQWSVAVAYTYARANRTYADAFGELLQAERFALDRRHFARLALRYSPTPQWAFGVTFSAGSGLPTRLPVANTLSPDIPSTNVPLTNSWTYSGPQIQLRNFQSLDLGVRRTMVRNDMAHRLTFGVQNAYLRRNPLFVNLQRRNDALPGQANYRYTQVSMLPFLPFFRYTITF